MSEPTYRCEVCGKIINPVDLSDCIILECECGHTGKILKDNDNDGLPEGIWYGGKGIGGEYYTKDVDALNSHSICVEGTESWTPEELEAIARHKRKLNSQSEKEK